MNDLKFQIKVLNELVSHNISEFDYFLPKELIAQDGLEKRDQSRLLVYSKENKEISHKIFENIIDYFDDGDVIVVNETKVNSWFLEGKKESQSKMAVTLTKRIDEKRFECFVLGRNPRKDGKIIFDKYSKQILGSEFLGDKEVSGYSDIIAMMIRNNIPVTKLSENDFNYTPPLSPFINLLSILGKKAKSLI